MFDARLCVLDRWNQIHVLMQLSIQPKKLRTGPTLQRLQRLKRTLAGLTHTRMASTPTPRSRMMARRRLAPLLLLAAAASHAVLAAEDCKVSPRETGGGPLRGWTDPPPAQALPDLT